MAYTSQQNSHLQSNSLSLNRTVGRPLLGDSLEEVSATLGEKLGRTDLQLFLLRPHPDIIHAFDTLCEMLSLPTTKAQINQPDGYSWTPLDYATRAFPEAAELLLQAGASPRSVTILLHQDGPSQWTAVSPLIRAGYPTDRRDLGDFGRVPLHSPAVDRQPSYRHALELVRHGGHLLDWEARDDNGHTPLNAAEYFADEEPDNEQQQLIRELYQTRQIPPHAQYISSFDGERLLDAEEAATYPRVSLIDTALAGDVGLIGRLISAGAMVNERDEDGRTLLHHLALHHPIPNREQIMLELVRHSGYWGIDWEVKTAGGRTASDLAAETLAMEDLDFRIREEVTQVQWVLQTRYFVLPDGMDYMFPCMDPRYCSECESLPCQCPENDVPGMPGSFS